MNALWKLYKSFIKKLHVYMLILTPCILSTCDWMNIFQTRDIIIVKQGWKLLEKFKCSLCATKVNNNVEITSVRSFLDLGNKFELENHLSS